MSGLIRRSLYALSAAIFGLGGLAHAAVFFRKSASDIAASDLSPFVQAELKGLWLCDSTTLVALAIVFLYLAARPSAASRMLILLITLVPAGTTLLLYIFIGAFYAAHLLLAAIAMIVVATVLPSGAKAAAAGSA